MRTRLTALLAAVAAVALTAGACSSDGSEGSGRGDGSVVRILASSELTDTEQVLTRAQEETGIGVEITWSGTLDATRLVASGGAEEYDALWLATNDYLRLRPEAVDRILTETSVMTSPVALGIRTEVVDRLGWNPEEVTWAQVHAAAAAGDLTFGMTDPTRSNSGYSALISVTSALSGAEAALTEEDVTGSAEELRQFFTGQRLTSGSSGWLATAFGDRPDVDALINYESVLLSLVRDGAGDLTVVRPLDGVVTARYPLTTLTSASPEARDALGTLTDHLRGQEAQAALTEQTLRRPVAGGVAPAEAIPDGQRRELPYPGTLAVADGLLDAFDNELRRPSRTVYVLDTSGSMEGERIESLRAALGRLTGTGTDGTGAGERFRERERVTLMPFAGQVVSVDTHTVEPADPEPGLTRIREGVEGLRAEGDTAIYLSLIEAYELLAEENTEDAFTSIVLMTDGENGDSVGPDGFADFHRTLPPALRTVPVFTVLFGDSDRGELEGIAELTGGRLFDAVDGSLDQAFQEIRGYQ
ncbi:VWA domain-containing protein [Streptomyces sp. 8K308]|uniref:vWA domain-containing protein n=1 Tax=Streptomyces sp. 8K308 TaxID=2530388 RepID=UPI001047223A|nr:substrate-binding domain-containing protein [Streptomyces sp. 8K308]TDC22115.1 VWA domain-containing protein [Streptomyces sp. 8K308]